ncbi:LytR family transcriptional regulator OS=Streptomyces fumanus OX=67302 GN=GCM10018772_33290 PE=3 SV=1 [Streptomyces fumanus]
MGYAVKGVGSTLKWQPAAARRLFTALREDKPLAAAGPRRPGAGRPGPGRPPGRSGSGRNGTRTPGLGRRVDKALAATGFRTTGTPVNAAAPAVERTVVAYDPRWDRSAKSLAAALPGSELGRWPARAPPEGHRGRRLRQVRPVGPEEPAQQPGAVVRGDEVVCGKP